MIEPSNSIKYKNKILILGLSNITEVDVINNKITLYEHGLFSPRVVKSFPVYFSNNNVYCFVSERGKLYFISTPSKFSNNLITNNIDIPSPQKQN